MISKIARRWYWITSGFFRKYFTGISIGLIVGVLVFANISKIIAYMPIKQTQHIGRVGAYTLSKLPLDIQQQVSRGLTSIDATGKAQLDAAQTMTISEEETAFTFTLDPSIFWSNGDKFTTKDLDLPLADVDIIPQSDEAVTFKLSEKFAPFPTIVSQPLLKKVTSGWPIKKTKIIGLNHFSITDIATQKNVITTLTLTSENTTIKYRFYPTEAEAITAFKLGKIDRIDHLTQPYLQDWPNVEVTTHMDPNRYLTLLFNTMDPNLQDKTVRQMLTYATPKQDGEYRVISPISQDSWAYNPQVKPYNYNIATAQSMYQKLQTANPNLSLGFTLTTTPAYQALAQEIIQAWQQLGIEVKLAVTPFPDTSDYQILLIGQQIPDDPDQYALWHSTQSTNVTHYQNPKIDKLLEDGRQEIDVEQRKVIYQDFQRFLVEDSPAAFLHQLPTYTLKRI